MVSFKQLFIISAICLGLGSLVFMLHRNWLIIHIALMPLEKNNKIASTMQNNVALPQPITISYYKNGNWLHTNDTVLWHENDTAFTLKHLLKKWLEILQEANLLSKHIAVTTAAVASTSSDAFISFDTTLFNKEMSIHAKWIIIESLLKTILDNNLTLHSLTVLHNDACMQDDHIDFRQALSLDSRL